MMKSKEFIAMLNKALNSKTVYGLGMWGQPITETIIASKSKQYPDWYIEEKNADRIRQYVGKDYFGFDCVCLIKAVLWGWNGNLKNKNGGANYGSNNVPDIGADTIITKCTNVSTDFKDIIPGALVWVKGHVGVYVGNGEVIECTTSWHSKVQRSMLSNLGYKGAKARKWTKWGKLPYVDYSDYVEEVKKEEPKPTEPTTYTVDKGDTLSGIGKKTNIKWQTIAKLNNIKFPYIIRVGQVLKLSDKPTTSSSATAPTVAEPTTYTVAKHDTLSGIGKQTGIKWQDIAKLNNIKFPYIIRVGQVLKLK